jgi:sRNA-binding protein
MSFEPEAIERLSPAARVEVQDFYARKFLAERERWAQERRAGRSASAAEAAPAAVAVPAARPRWPRVVWFRNDTSRQPRVQTETAGGRN